MANASPDVVDRQVRIFVPSAEPWENWYPTLLGRVVRPLVSASQLSLPRFWFTRYVVEGPNGDIGDCDFDSVPETYKSRPVGVPNEWRLPIHRSIRLRFSVEEQQLPRLTSCLYNFVEHNNYFCSTPLRDYSWNEFGSDRFVGPENKHNTATRIATLSAMMHGFANLVLETLVDDGSGRYRFESNDARELNISGSSFESPHHLYCNSTSVSLIVWVDENGVPHTTGGRGTHVDGRAFRVTF